MPRYTCWPLSNINKVHAPSPFYTKEMPCSKEHCDGTKTLGVLWESQHAHSQPLVIVFSWESATTVWLMSCGIMLTDVISLTNFYSFGKMNSHKCILNFMLLQTNLAIGDTNFIAIMNQVHYVDNQVNLNCQPILLHVVNNLKRCGVPWNIVMAPKTLVVLWELQHAHSPPLVILFSWESVAIVWLVNCGIMLTCVTSLTSNYSFGKMNSHKCILNSAIGLESWTKFPIQTTKLTWTFH